MPGEVVPEGWIAIPNERLSELQSYEMKWNEISKYYKDIESPAKVKEWKEKARKWDEYSETLFDKAAKWDEYIDKNQLLVSQERLDELKEKAQKWDEFEKRNLTKCEQEMDCTIIPNDDLDDLKKKAKKWNDYIDKNQLLVSHFTPEYWKITVKKAAKWDELKKSVLDV